MKLYFVNQQSELHLCGLSPTCENVEPDFSSLLYRGVFIQFPVLFSDARYVLIKATYSKTTICLHGPCSHRAGPIVPAVCHRGLSHQQNREQLSNRPTGQNGDLLRLKCNLTTALPVDSKPPCPLYSCG